ncbi:MAG TPA: hypothetical protein VEC17_00870 [Candidatus Binatia bacterium]|nr:hypothetical protein [Candidatus Binatia bacterium]
MKLKFLPIVLALILLVPFVVAAQNSTGNPCTGGGNLGACVSRIYIWSIGISALLAVMMTVFGGYWIMTARGNGAQVEKGKDYIRGSLIGMVLLLAAYLILNTINTDLTDFNTTNLNAPASTPATNTPANNTPNTNTPTTNP